MVYKRVQDRRDCRNRFYKNHRESEKAAKAKRKSEITSWFRNYKQSCSCIECGETHPACLEFHHVDPKKKEYNIYFMVKNGHSIENIKRELAKCVPLCKNCHAKFHWKD